MLATLEYSEWHCEMQRQCQTRVHSDIHSATHSLPNCHTLRHTVTHCHTHCDTPWWHTAQRHCDSNTNKLSTLTWPLCGGGAGWRRATGDVPPSTRHVGARSAEQQNMTPCRESETERHTMQGGRLRGIPCSHSLHGVIAVEFPSSHGCC